MVMLHTGVAVCWVTQSARLSHCDNVLPVAMPQGGCVQVYTIREGRDREGSASGHPPEVLAAEAKLCALREKLQHARSAHLCHFQLFEIRSTLAYMVRPYVYSTLHERVQVHFWCSC